MCFIVVLILIIMDIHHWFLRQRYSNRHLFAIAALHQVLSLIEENTAAALHYGIDRVFDQPHTVLYYNMGAGSVQVHIL